MQFQKFAEFLSKIEQTSGRNEMMESLAQFLVELSAEEIAPVMYLMQGRLLPNYVGLEFNFSQKLGQRAIVDAGIGSETEVNKAFADAGDLGDAVNKLKTKDQKTSIDITTVYDELMDLAKLEGKGSQEAKIKKFGELMLELDPLSAKYVARVITGSLRLGLSDKTVLDALSWAKAGDKSLRTDLDKAYGAKADIGELAKLVLKSDLSSLPQLLRNIKLEPGTPVASKLVERESSAEATFERMGTCLVQPKLDGLRCQIHLLPKENVLGHRVEIFSRNMESLTEMFPDIVEAAQKLPAKSAIIDSEAIGYDFENDAYLPFQQTIQRKRKYDVSEAAESIPVRSMAFDLLYIDGEDISQEKLEVRMQKLELLLENKAQNIIVPLETIQLDSADKLDAYFQEKIGAGLEGVIVKKLGTTYDPGTRNFDWIKLKANTQAEMVDTIDAVVIGYFRGQGARAKFGIGALLVALYSDDDDKFYSVAKVGTGMSDEQWKTIKSDLQPLEVSSQPESVVVDKILHPDVWVKPEIVMEIDADQITRSPGHTAARGVPAKFEEAANVGIENRGLSLRFPRMKVWKRDKKATQATSVTELLRMYDLRNSKMKVE